MINAKPPAVPLSYGIVLAPRRASRGWSPCHASTASADDATRSPGMALNFYRHSLRRRGLPNWERISDELLLLGHRNRHTQ